MRNGNLGDLEDQMCGALRQLTTSTSGQKQFSKLAPQITQFLQHYGFRKITPSTDSTNSIPRLDMGFNISKVWNQPKDGFSKSLYDNQKNLVFDRPKRNGSESHSHSRKIKYDDGQTESSGDEWRLLSPTKNLSIHSRNTAMLPNSGHVCFKKEQIIEEICIGDTNKRSGQCQKCSKNRLEKIHIPCVITTPNSSDSEDYTEVRQRRFKNHPNCPEMEGTSMVDASRGIHNVSNNTKRRREHSDTRKKHQKKKYISTTWEIRSPIVNEYFKYETIGGLLLQAFISGKPVKNLLFLELKNLKNIAIFVCRKLYLAIGSIVGVIVTV
jgi:hypothetical protein